MFSLLVVKKKKKNQLLCLVWGRGSGHTVVHKVAVCIDYDSSFSGQGNPAVVCGIVFRSTACSFHSEALQTVEVVGAVNSAAEHHLAGGGSPAVRHESRAARWV